MSFCPKDSLTASKFNYSDSIILANYQLQT